MLDISVWMQSFLRALENAFENRVWFVGLQGSYGRGEATEQSDIDVVVILDELTATDIHTYNEMLGTLSHRELICGFLAGKEELLAWESSDLFQFYHDTTPVKGSLDELLPLLGKEAVERAVKIGACNLYHGCVHNMLHEKSAEILKSLYKTASFVVQASVFLRTGRYFRHQTELFAVASTQEQEILQTFAYLKNGGAAKLDSMSERLFVWVKKMINNGGDL